MRAMSTLQVKTISRSGLRGLARAFLLLAPLALAHDALAQPQEEPVPEGVLGLAEVRVFIDSPIWFAWKLPSSKVLLAYVRGPEGADPTSVGQLAVLDGKGRLDAKRTRELKAAFDAVEAADKCMETGEGRMPLLMPLGGKGLVLQSSAQPRRSCLFTWNARGPATEVRSADSVRDFCGPSGCPPKECWLTESCWLPEGPDLDAARKGFHPSPVAQSLMNVITAPGKAVLAATLPGSGYVLVWAPSWRAADVGDPAKGMDSRLFVYNSRKKAIDMALTRKLAAALQKPMDECQGLGTVEELQQSGKSVKLHQRYASGTLQLDCSSTVTWKGGKFEVKAHPLGDGSPGVSGHVPKQEADDDHALALWRSGKRELALAMWEQLYARADYQNPAFADVCSNLGFAYHAIRESKKAEEVLLDCEKSFPERATIQLHLGDVYRDTRRPQEAIERYQHFLEMEGGTPEQRKAAEKSLDRLKGRP